MDKSYTHQSLRLSDSRIKAVIVVLIAAMLTPFNLFSVTLANAPDASSADEPQVSISEPDSTAVIDAPQIAVDLNDRVVFVADSIDGPQESIVVEAPSTAMSYDWLERPIEFNPDPTRAAWMAAIFPGLGQVYNRRYWKLPLILGGYLGLGYATNWNNTMLRDYTKAYADLTDSDPSTKSYMDFFPSHVKEEQLDKKWLTNLMQSRKNYFRRNRDLCIISMVGVYLLAIVDAYVDASLSHFDISPDLSMDLYPTLIQDGRNKLPSIGLHWAFNF